MGGGGEGGVLKYNTKSYLYIGSAFCTILSREMRELDLEAADDDDDDDVAAATASAFGFNNAILLSSRCCMTMQRTCDTNFPSTCSAARQPCHCTACARCVCSVYALMAAAADLLPHAPRVVQVHVKRGLQVKHCTHLMQQRDGVTCDV